MPTTKSMKLGIYTLAIIAGFSAAAIAGPGWQYGGTNCGPAAGVTGSGTCKSCCSDGVANGDITVAEEGDCTAFCDQAVFNTSAWDGLFNAIDIAGDAIYGAFHPLEFWF